MLCVELLFIFPVEPSSLRNSLCVRQICPVFAHNGGISGKRTHRSRKVPLILDVNSLPSGTIETMNGHCVMSGTPGVKSSSEGFPSTDTKAQTVLGGSFLDSRIFEKVCTEKLSEGETTC